MVKIIIIDDDMEQVESIKILMKLKKIEVVAVGYNGKDAVELYKKYKPDVVLLDLMMPEYDGCYAIEEITKLDPNAKVILVSGSLDQEAKKIAKYKTVHSMISKPFLANDLIKKIANVRLINNF